MSWKDKLIKAFISGLLFSMLYNLIFLMQGVSIAKFIAFTLIFTALYFAWLMPVPDQKNKKK